MTTATRKSPTNAAPNGAASTRARRKAAAPRFSRAPQPFLWDVEKYHQMADWCWFRDQRVELIEGVIYEKYPPHGAEPRPFRWTRAQYYRMGEHGWFDQKRVELIDGEIIEMAPIGSEHAVAVVLAQKELEHAFGSDFHVRSQAPLSFEESSEPEPDIAVVRGAIRDYSAAHPTQATLIIEVSDATLRLDRTTKARLYARAGIAEYWILNLRARQLETFRAPRNGKYSQTRVLAETETVSPLEAPDAEIAIADLLP